LLYTNIKEQDYSTEYVDGRKEKKEGFPPTSISIVQQEIWDEDRGSKYINM
jgi:hypothetical protein